MCRCHCQPPHVSPLSEHPSKPHADMWRDANVIDDPFRSVGKVKAHTDFDPNWNAETAIRWKVNDCADRFADTAARECMPSIDYITSIEEYRALWLSFLTGSLNMLAAWMSPKELNDGEPVKRPKLGPIQVNPAATAVHHHHIGAGFANAMWRCTSCFARSKTAMGLVTKPCSQ